MSRVSTDPIADMLTRIRNAALVNLSDVRLPNSRIKQELAKILKENGYIEAYSVDGKAPKEELLISLVSAGNNPVINEIARISTPGRRTYAKSTQIPVVKQGRGMVIMSTSKGIMTGEEARRQSIGGELICKVY